MSRHIYKFIFCIVVLNLMSVQCARSEEIVYEEILSPSKNLKVRIKISSDFEVSLLKEDSVFLKDIKINISPDKANNYFDFKKEKLRTTRRNNNEIITSKFYTQSNIEVCNHYLNIKINDYWNLEITVFDNAFAYRWKYKDITPTKVYNEKLQIENISDNRIIFSYVNSKGKNIESQLRSSFENTYTDCGFADIDDTRLMFLPAIFSKEQKKIFFTEVNTYKYPGLYLKKEKKDLVALFAEYPERFTKGGDGNQDDVVTRRYDYIASLNTATDLPWRVFLVAEDEIKFLENNTPYILATPTRLDDVSWIKPGKAVWDWWHGNSLYNVDFKVGKNTDTYKYYIDFASKYKIPYVLIDAGWYQKKKDGLCIPKKEFDIEVLTKYAENKNVGIILWVRQSHIANKLENHAKYFNSIGVKGIKIDFLDRDDQVMNQFCYDCAEIMAKYELLVDFHGSPKPTGLNRTFPNVVSFEGVNGMEQMKWVARDYDQMTYDTYLPFLRQMAGPMDYTPGAMINAGKKDFYPSYNHPMSQGTRCHQLAQYVVFFSPLSMLCDTPMNYLNNIECLEFISSIPTVWDETVIIDGQIGKYIVLARRKGRDWYIGGLTNWEKKDIEIDLSFIKGKIKNSIFFLDGINTDKNASDYSARFNDIPDNRHYLIKMSSGGGFAGKISIKY